MRARHGLQVVLRVPVRIEDDDRVGRNKVDAHPAGARREQEHEVGASGGVEVLDGLVALLGLHAAVKTLVRMPAQRHVVGENVEHHDKLRENEDAMATIFQSHQKFVKQDHLAAAHDQPLKLFALQLRRLLGVWEKVRVITGLLELHGNVQPLLLLLLGAFLQGAKILVMHL
ncbi:hypothetical protein BC936DRAFT_143532 [Jimgerdemannia flammicorona]|uniref:Uncharacterized protein n=1 Tax=Jimgerdemannia flammicorona TaxID=994334 RepID=A0A433DDP6_9FUNG|nr:hypothetical protein BC936DRAFT_143532 [Jimgerdemannia flammicorona]